MRVGRGALLMALALGACSRPGASTETTDAGTTGLPGRPSPLLLPACEELLPADLRDITLNGFTMKEQRACPTCGPVCELRSAALPDVSVSVAYDCQPGYATADVRALLAPTLNAGGEEVPALGRAAARRNPVQGMTQVVAWDDDSPCVVVVTWLGEDPDRALDVARLAVTSHHGMEQAADAGELLPGDAGDSPFKDGPLEPLDSLTSPRAGTTDVLSAPPGAGSMAPRPATPVVTPVKPKPAPKPVTPAPPAAAPAPKPVHPTLEHAAPAPKPVHPAPEHAAPAPKPVTPAPDHAAPPLAAPDAG